MKRDSALLLAILAIALVVRVIYVCTLPPEIFWYDGIQYSNLATGLVQHGVYGGGPGHSSAFWPPGYPFLLAAVYAVFGVNVPAVRLVQCALGTLAVLFTYRIATRALEPRAALFAALVGALYPLFIYSAGAFFPVTLQVALLAGCVWLSLRALERHAALDAAGAGAMAGWATLTAGSALPALLLIGPWMAWASRGSRRPELRLAAVYFAVLLAVVGAWTIRNQRVLGRPVLISTNFGYNLWLGNYPGVRASTGSRYDEEGMDAEAKRIWDRPGSEATRDAEFARLALRHIAADIPAFARLTFAKAGEFWAVYSEPMTQNRPRSQAEWLASLLSYGLLLPFAGFWLLRSLPRSRLATLVWCFAAVYTLVHALILAKVRYRLPLDTFVILYGAGGMAALAGRLGSLLRRDRARGVER